MTAFGQGQNTNVSFFIENESTLSFDETLLKIKTELESKAWKISATHDLQQTMKSNGYEVLPVVVLSVCHPGHSVKILQKDDERIVTPLMPCRISIYKKSDGKTYISRMNAPAFAGSLDEISAEVMNGAFHEIEGILREIIIN